MHIGVEYGGGSSHTLQPDRLPHQQHFMVLAGRHDKQVARFGSVNCGLNRLTSRQSRRGLAANGYGHGVDRFLAVAGRDDQFSAACAIRRTGGAAILLLLLHGTKWHLTARGVRQSDDNRGVAPTANVGGYATDGDTSCALCGAKAIVTGDRLLVIRRQCSRWPGVAVIAYDLVAQSMDRDGVSGSGRKNPGANSITVHLADRRGGIRVGTVGM